MNDHELLDFQPCLFMRCGHRQTVLGSTLPGGRFPYRARPHTLKMSDDDELVVHDDVPASWKETDAVALLVHGLGGDHRSGYMVRVAAKLHRCGVRVFRMDQRGCGAAQWLSAQPAHAGRSDDIAEVLDWVESCCPRAPLTLVGFSLGGNAVLKLAGERGASDGGNLRLVLAVAPPIDLAYCAKNLARPERRFYDRRFLRKLCRQVRLRSQRVAAARGLDPGVQPGSVLEFDDGYTAPVSGFQDAGDYYARCSAGPLLKSIEVSTRILVAEDDPVVPVEIFSEVPVSQHVGLFKTRYGGHLGYLGVRGIDSDRRWMDWRIVDWITSAST
ncbi:MAG: alpha/beta fold hydrolase [Pirellulaceae bacterium]